MIHIINSTDLSPLSIDTYQTFTPDLMYQLDESNEQEQDEFYKDFNHNDYVNQLATLLVKYMNETLLDDKILSISLMGSSSPKSYNYTTDNAVLAIDSSFDTEEETIQYINSKCEAKEKATSFSTTESLYYYFLESIS